MGLYSHSDLTRQGLYDWIVDVTHSYQRIAGATEVEVREHTGPWSPAVWIIIARPERNEAVVPAGGTRLRVVSWKRAPPRASPVGSVRSLYPCALPLSLCPDRT